MTVLFEELNNLKDNTHFISLQNFFIIQLLLLYASNLILQILEKSHGDSGEFDATSSNENDSDDEDGKEHSPGDEAQDSPGIRMTPANFDPDVSKIDFT